MCKYLQATLNLQLSNGERIETTAEHPFYVQGRGWTPAGEIGLGTSIVTRAGPSLALNGALPMAHTAAPVALYNFTVEEFHSYFVGQSALWVHNAGEGGICALFSNQATASRVGDFNKGTFIQGRDGQLYHYGESVKNLDLRGKSADEIHQLLTTPGSRWDYQLEFLPNPDFPQAYPHRIYRHPDGGVVRVKPNGQYLDTLRPGPHASKSVQKVPGTDTSFDNEGFKVDNLGDAGPKWTNTNEFQYPDDIDIYVPGTDPPVLTPEAKTIADIEMDRLHTNLPQGEQI